MLARVLHGLHATEVDGRLDIGRVAGDALGLDEGGQRGPSGRRLQRLADAAVDEKGRVDAVGQRPQLLDGLTHVLGQLVQSIAWRAVGVALGQLAGEAQARTASATQVLLRAVVEVPLDLAPRRGPLR